VPFIAKLESKGNLSPSQSLDFHPGHGPSPAAPKGEQTKLLMFRINISRLTLDFMVLKWRHCGFHLKAGGAMKKWSLVLLAVAVVMPTAALAQHSSKAAETKPADSNPQAIAPKAVTISGQVSEDEKTLVGDDDGIWTVSNPGVLAGHRGQQVLVKCQLLAGKSEIQVFSVKMSLREVKYVSKSGDSAFRR
jgi:hypothetical protein